MRVPRGSSSSTRWTVLAGAAVVLIFLVVRSPTRRIGDGPEYVAMALQLSRLERPSLGASETAHTLASFAEIAGGFGVFTESFRYPQLEASDGRRDFPHFWLYPALAAPGVALASALGLHPNVGFVLTNAALFLGALWIVSGMLGWPGSVLLFASPILWWIDKAHTEVFTFSLLSIALALLEPAPWWSLVAVAAASAQNLPIALALPPVAAAAVTLRPAVWREPRFRLGIVASAALALLHPAYYWLRLGTPEPQTVVGGARLRLPGLLEIGAFVWDPNLGILPNFPALALALLGALMLVAVRRPRALLRPPLLLAAVLAMLFTASFAQTTNFNSGGTFGPGRYGVWLIPLAIPVLAEANRWGRRRWHGLLAAIAVLSAVSGLVLYRPERPESYRRANWLASVLWERLPWLDNPLPEVFVERTTGYDITAAALIPAATPSCTKVLLIGGRWPEHCQARAIPATCAPPGAYCYANRRADGTYGFRIPGR
jgi:hypothetical protein